MSLDSLIKLYLISRSFLTFSNIDNRYGFSTKTNNYYTAVLGVNLLKKFIWENKDNFTHSSAIFFSSFDWPSHALNRKILNNINEVNRKNAYSFSETICLLSHKIVGQLLYFYPLEWIIHAPFLIGPLQVLKRTLINRMNHIRIKRMFSNCNSSLSLRLK